MKYTRILPVAIIFTACLIHSGCKKEDEKPGETTTTPAVVITSSTVFTDNTVGYIGGTLESAYVYFFGVQGDSAGYIIQASVGSDEIFIKTYSPNFPATTPATGTYSIYNLNNMCDTCSHPLLPNEAIMLCRGVVTSGNVNVAMSGSKYVYTFTNITVEGYTQPWSGKLVSP